MYLKPCLTVCLTVFITINDACKVFMLKAVLQGNKNTVNAETFSFVAVFLKWNDLSFVCMQIVLYPRILHIASYRCYCALQCKGTLTTE